MNKPKMLLTASLMAVTLSAASLAVAAPAQAQTDHGCNWPRVCFYLTTGDWDRSAPTASFQDMGYWQNLGSRSRGAYMVYNSRDNDGALLHFTSGMVVCNWPNEVLQVNVMDHSTPITVDQIKIMDSPTCGY